jgi:hypothetical protein
MSSSNENPNTINLGNNDPKNNKINDFGDDELNNLFQNLDEKTKQDILRYPKKEIQISILKDMNNEELKKIYNNLPSEEKEIIDNVKIRDKYLMLKHLMKKDQTQLEKKGKNKIALIIPFRDLEESKARSKQLQQFEKYMEKYLSDQDYKIFVIEQTDDKRKFNRGQLLNIGFEIADSENYDHFIFHDVDLLPSEELKEYYIKTPSDRPVHIASVWERYGSNPNYFGGIVSFNREMFKQINGYPNNFWGWGGEDDELLKRTQKFYTLYYFQTNKRKNQRFGRFKFRRKTQLFERK